MTSMANIQKGENANTNSFLRIFRRPERDNYDSNLGPFGLETDSLYHGAANGCTLGLINFYQHTL